MKRTRPMARNVLGTRRMATSTFDEVASAAWSVRPEQPLDLDQIHDLHRAAFGRPDEAELVDAIRSGPDFIPELSLVAAAADGSVLGHVLVSRIGFEEEAFAARGDVLALAPLAVLPPYGGQGIASALTAQVLAVADKRDEPFVFVLGAPSFYARFGFIAASSFDIESPYSDAGNAFQVRSRPDGPAPVPGTVFYPRIFDQLGGR
jgi:putative acetyltransferase